ncbi:MAG: hypothetical protein MUP47_02190 [Phycisphaerae bacterium]|nr:hypothetical protein [Phycisphaerae bacterium]
MRYGLIAMALMLVIVAFLPIGGCSAANQDNGTLIITPTSTQPTPPGMIPPQPKVEFTAGKTSATRVLSPFGKPPGDVISSVGKRDWSYDPATGKFSVRAGENKATLWDYIKYHVQGVIGLLLLTVGAFVALWFIPATHSFVVGILAFIGAAIPWVGHALQKARGDAALTDVVQTVQDARKALAANGDAEALKVVDAWLVQQTPATQALVERLKAAAGVTSVTDPKA